MPRQSDGGRLYTGSALHLVTAFSLPAEVNQTWHVQSFAAAGDVHQGAGEENLLRSSRRRTVSFFVLLKWVPVL